MQISAFSVRFNWEHFFMTNSYTYLRMEFQVPVPEADKGWEGKLEVSSAGSCLTTCIADSCCCGKDWLWFSSSVTSKRSLDLKII